MDNIGAIQLVRNNVGGAGTRHVNVRYHYVRELHEKVIELVFVRSDQNDSDILTKNPTRVEFERHGKKLVAEVPGVLRGEVNVEQKTENREDVKMMCEDKESESLKEKETYDEGIKQGGSVMERKVIECEIGGRKKVVIL